MKNLKLQLKKMSQQETSSPSAESTEKQVVLMKESRNYMGHKPTNKKRMVEVKRPVYDFPLDDFSIFGKVSDEDLKLNSTYALHTALCYIPPESLWDPVQDIRQEIDKVCLNTVIWFRTNNREWKDGLLM